MDLVRAQKIEAASSPEKQEYYEYTISYGTHEKSRKISFSFREISHLAIAIALVFGVGLSLVGFPQVRSESLILIGSLAAIVTISFLTHEISHKLIAQTRGLWAEFRLTLVGAILTLLSVISPLLKVISPGAVVVSGYTDVKTLGKISLAGPIMNLIFSTTFLTAFMLARTDSALARIFVIGAVFNAWISLINLLPFGILDGQKVFAWDKGSWAVTFFIGLALTVTSVWFYSQPIL